MKCECCIRIIQAFFYGLLLCALCLISLTVSDVYALNKSAENRIKIALPWKINTPGMRKTFYNPWDGLHRIGLGLEYERKMSQRFNAIISVEYIDNSASWTKKGFFVVKYQPHEWLIKSYRHRSVNAGLIYLNQFKKVDFGIAGTVGLSKMNFNYSNVAWSTDESAQSKVIPGYEDVLSGHDTAVLLQGKGSLYYSINKLGVEFVYIEFAMRIYALRIQGTMRTAFRHPADKLLVDKPRKSLTSGPFLKIGIGRSF